MTKKTVKKTKKANIGQIEKNVKKVIADILEVDVKKLTPKTRFVEDLGMDSMMALEILSGIEKTYKIQIPEESLTKMRNLNDVIKLTEELLSKK